MIPFGPKPVPEHRWFESKSVPQRLFILLAGVTMNALLTIVVLFGLNWAVGNRVLETTRVGVVADRPETAALRAFVRPGDAIISVQGEPVANWNDVVRLLLVSPGETLSFATNDGAVMLPAGAPAGRLRGVIMESLRPYAPPVIAAVAAGRPAAAAGFMPGDSVVSIDGLPVRSSDELIQIVSASAGRDINVNLVRANEPLVITVRPDSDTATDPVTQVAAPVGRIGIQLAASPQTHAAVGPGAALGLAVQQTGDLAMIIVRALKGLVQRDVAFSDLGGPLEIARVSGQAAQQGIIPPLELLALLSINLAVLNLLPIPVLDGGQILILLAESVKGSPFSPKARQIILGTGVALVLLLMLAVSYNDVLRMFGS
jgi:regulator of sigma E protease